MTFDKDLFNAQTHHLLELLYDLADPLSLAGNFHFPFSSDTLPYYLTSQRKRAKTLHSAHENMEITTIMDDVARTWEKLHSLHSSAYPNSLSWERDSAELVVFPGLKSAHYRIGSLSDDTTSTTLAKDHRIGHLLACQSKLDLENATRTFTFKVHSPEALVYFRAASPEEALKRFTILYPGKGLKGIVDFFEYLDKESYL